MIDYKEILDAAEKITKTLVYRLNSLNSFENVSVSYYTTLKDFFVSVLKNYELADVSKAFEESMNITKKEVYRLNSLNSFENVKIWQYIEIFKKHFKNFLPPNNSSNEKNIKSHTNTNENNESSSENYAVFISHAIKDKTLAGLIKKLLFDFGINSFVAHDDIERGEEWKPAIIQGLKNSTILLVLCTKKIEDSAWVNFEIGLGYDKMIPFIIEPLTDKVSYIKDKQGVIANFDSLNLSIKLLISTILDKLGLSQKYANDNFERNKNFVEIKDYLTKNFHSDKNGILIQPSKVDYTGNSGLTKTLLITNQNDHLCENVGFSIKWLTKDDLKPELIDIDKVFRVPNFSMTLSDAEGYSYKNYQIPSIKPNQSVQFDLILRSNSKDKFEVYIVKDEPITVTERVQ